MKERMENKMKRRRIEIIAFVMMLILLVTCFQWGGIASQFVGSAVAHAEMKPYALYELTERRLQDTKHFLFSDGSIKAYVYPLPVHYMDENGEWKDIDNTLKSEEGKYSISENSFELSFAADAERLSLNVGGSIFEAGSNDKTEKGVGRDPADRIYRGYYNTE